MSYSVNKVILIGNLGAEPELRYTKGGTAVCNLRVATSESWVDKDGQRQEQTEWHRIVAWAELAELCNEYLSKGRKVYVEGSLRIRKWQDREGNDRYTTEVNAREVVFLDSKGGGSKPAGGNPNGPPPSADDDDIPF